jgi:hypothetical protein
MASRDPRQFARTSGSAAPAHDEGIWHHRRRRPHADAYARHGRSVRVRGWHGEKSQARCQSGAERIARTPKSAGPGTRAVSNFNGGVTASADLVESGAISGKMLKDLYDLCFERGQDFPAVYEAEGRPEQSRDTSALEKLADELDRRESEAGGAISRGQENHDRIFRGPGDEGFEGASESAAGE